MSDSTSTFDPAGALTFSRRRWIDGLLVAGGVACTAASWPIPGAAIAALGLVAPIVSRTRRERGAGAVTHLVPAALAARYRQLIAAASLPGTPDPASVVAAADDALLEVAALLGGRPPRGAAQRRFVTARTDAMADVAEELRERHAAYVAARDELERMGPAMLPVEPDPPRQGILVGGLVAVLLPVFVLWDLVRLTGTGLVALVDGVALRLRTTLRLVANAGHAAVALLARARQAWNELRAAFVAATKEARHRVASARIRLRLRIRRARVRVRRDGARTSSGSPR